MGQMLADSAWRISPSRTCSESIFRASQAVLNVTTPTLFPSIHFKALVRWLEKSWCPVNLHVSKFAVRHSIMAQMLRHAPSISWRLRSARDSSIQRSVNGQGFSSVISLAGLGRPALR